MRRLVTGALMIGAGAAIASSAHAQTTGGAKPRTTPTTASTKKSGRPLPAGTMPKGVPVEVKAGTPGLPPGMKPPESLPVPTTFDELFAARDARAIDALNYLQCLQVTAAAAQGGALGSVPRSLVLVCVEHEGEWRGVFSEPTPDASTVKVRYQYAMRGNGQLTRDPIDTAKVAGVSYALLRGITVPVPGKGQHAYLPVPLPQPTFIELWFLPIPGAPDKAIVGGDSLIQMSSDGKRELGHSRSTPPIRTLSVAAGPSYTLRSLEERIPLLSELMVAHMALSLAPDVRVQTRQYESAFSRTSARVKHVQR